MKKSLYTIVNFIFGIVFISLVFIFFLDFSENVSKNTYPELFILPETLT